MPPRPNASDAAQYLVQSQDTNIKLKNPRRY